jgi:drug/metabolite transporter (DMT)-like permease
MDRAARGGSFSTGRSTAAGALGMSIVGGSVAVSHTLVDAPVLTAQAIRYAAASVLLLLLARAARVSLSWPRGREWAYLVGIAATGLVLFNLAVVRGVAHAEPAVIAVAVACVPILIGVVGPLLDGQRPRRPTVLAAGVVTVGGVLVQGTGRTDAVGVGWAVVTLLCEASFTLLAVPVLRRHGAWGVSVHAVWLATAMFAVLALLVEGPTATLRLDGADWAAVGYLAVLVTAVAFLAWYSCVSALGPARAGLLTGIAPIAAAAAGVVTLGNLPRPLVWVGIAVVAAGLVAGLLPSRRAVPADRPKPAAGQDQLRPGFAERRPRHAGRGAEEVTTRGSGDGYGVDPDAEGPLALAGAADGGDVLHRPDQRGPLGPGGSERQPVQG